MGNCPSCGHPGYAHLLGGEGQCQYWIVKEASDWIPTDEFGKDTKAWSMSVEYEGQCPCTGFSSTKLTKKSKTITLDTFH